MSDWLVIELIDSLPQQIVRKASYEEACALAIKLASENDVFQISEEELDEVGGFIYPHADNSSVWVSELPELSIG